jgi:copper(I)-binding protein
MKRIVALVIVALFTAIAFWFAPKGQSAITLSNATAAPIDGQPGMYMVSVTIHNDGPAAILAAVTSAEADMVTVMNPDAPTATLVVPAGGSGSLAMDGAHIMLRIDPASFEQGALIPLSLQFADGTQVTTRVMNTGPSDMQHGQTNGVAVTPAPTLSLDLPQGPCTAGFPLALRVENFTFVQADGDAVHVPNQGHAHVYLNGLKLGRLYAPTFDVGGLAPGTYRLRVSLNTNDHRPYLKGGAAVSQVVDFALPQ